MSTEAMKLALDALEGSTDKTLSIRAITALREALAQPQQEPDCVLVPRDLIGAACSAIDRKRDAPKTLEQLRRYTVGDLSTTQPAQPQQEPVAKVDANDEGYWADILPDRTVKVGQLLYAEAPQPAQQDPVEYWTVANGWVSDQAEVPAAVWVEPDFWEHCNRVNCGTAYRLPAPGRQPLYTSPPARKPLTDKELEEVVKRGAENKPFHHWFARAIEAAHGIKGDA